MQENENQEPEIVEAQEELNLDEDIELDILESLEEVENKEKEAPTDSQQEPAKVETKQEEPAKEAQSEPVEDLKAPATWTLEQKEWFNQQDPVAKKAHLSRAQNLERLTHEAMQTKAEIKKEYSDIDEAVKPYEAKWNAKGISRSQALRALAEANDKLDEDPIAGTLQILASYGLTVDDLVNGAQNGEAQPQAQANPQMQQMQQELAAMKNHFTSQQQADQSAKQQQELSQIYTVRDETDASGRYLRPEMHDEKAAELIGKQYMFYKSQGIPGTAKELMTKSYSAYKASLGQPTAPASATPIQKQNAQRAALSVPGSSVSSVAPIVDVPDSVEDTVDQVFAEFGYQTYPTNTLTNKQDKNGTVH